MRKIRDAIHDFIGHPLKALCYVVGLKKLGDKIHDATIPKHRSELP